MIWIQNDSGQCVAGRDANVIKLKERIMMTQEKVEAMDWADRRDMEAKINDVLDRAFVQNTSWDGAKDELQEIYHQFGTKISRADFNALVESSLEGTRDCYQLMLDGCEGAEDVIRL